MNHKVLVWHPDSISQGLSCAAPFLWEFHVRIAGAKCQSKLEIVCGVILILLQCRSWKVVYLTPFVEISSQKPLSRKVCAKKWFHMLLVWYVCTRQRYTVLGANSDGAIALHMPWERNSRRSIVGGSDFSPTAASFRSTEIGLSVSANDDDQLDRYILRWRKLIS